MTLPCSVAITTGYCELDAAYFFVSWQRRYLSSENSPWQWYDLLNIGDAGILKDAVLSELSYADLATYVHADLLAINGNNRRFNLRYARSLWTQFDPGHVCCRHCEVNVVFSLPWLRAVGEQRSSMRRTVDVPRAEVGSCGLQFEWSWKLKHNCLHRWTRLAYLWIIRSSWNKNLANELSLQTTHTRARSDQIVLIVGQVRWHISGLYAHSRCAGFIDTVTLLAVAYSNCYFNTLSLCIVRVRLHCNGGFRHRRQHPGSDVARACMSVRLYCNTLAAYLRLIDMWSLL